MDRFSSNMRVHLVDSELVNRQLFDFRYRPQTGSRLFFRNRKLKISDQFMDIPEKRVLVATRFEKSTIEDRTPIIKTDELSDEIFFDFRVRKKLVFGLR